MERIRRQNEREISVVIGNPPWNASQKSENDNNKNRTYPGVDSRIKATYIAESAAQKTKLYDMYARFIRWASDRIGENGVLAFVTNSSFIDATSFDGFRKVVAREFNELHILDLRGGILGKAKNEAARQGGNIFNVKVGVAVWFFVRKAELRGCQIWHCATADGMSAADKLALLFPNKALNDFDFRSIVPDSKNRWVKQTNNDFGELTPLVEIKTRAATVETSGERALFKLFFNGVATNRDSWVYESDFEKIGEKSPIFPSGISSADDFRR